MIKLKGFGKLKDQDGSFSVGMKIDPFLNLYSKETPRLRCRAVNSCSHTPVVAAEPTCGPGLQATHPDRMMVVMHPIQLVGTHFHCGKGSKDYHISMRRSCNKRLSEHIGLWNVTGLVAVFLMIAGSLSWANCLCEGCCSQEVSVVVEDDCSMCCVSGNTSPDDAETVTCGSCSSLEPFIAETVLACPVPVLATHQPTVTRTEWAPAESPSAQGTFRICLGDSPPAERPLILRI